MMPIDFEESSGGNHAIEADKRAQKKEENFERALHIINIKTKVDIAWQDGTIEQGRESTALIPVDTPGDHDFVPAQYVIEKVTDEDDNPDEVRRVGVVKSVNAKDRTACVRWIKPAERAEDPSQFVEEVSVYELEVHPEYDYCYRDVVVSWAPVSMIIQTMESATEDSKQLFDGSKLEQDKQLNHLNEKREGGSHGVRFNVCDYCFGYVTSLRDGVIEVTWTNGIKSMVGPDSIHLFNHDTIESTSGSEDSNDDASLEIVEDEEIETSQNDIEDASLIDHEIEESATTPEEPHTSQCEEGRYGFKRFDTTGDSSGHHFAGKPGKTGSTKWSKKVLQDWDILKKNLPDGIYVRVYEDRMDLVRAAIVGAFGTPYHDGLYFFDFHLPSEYPDVPPVAYYHSGSHQINPNLYTDGKVCLSLLNTWTGKGTEKWDPSSSSILQLLVSIQGLVLTSKPYFNEAGYDKKIDTDEGEKNSLSYNEHTFVLNCSRMVYFMQKPLKGFEDLITEHFRKRGDYILGACDAYREGYLIGTLAEDVSLPSNDVSPRSNSVGFNIILASIVPKHNVALREIGADCEAKPKGNLSASATAPPKGGMQLGKSQKAEQFLESLKVEGGDFVGQSKDSAPPPTDPVTLAVEEKLSVTF